MQLFEKHQKVSVDDYVIPLDYPQWNQERLIKGFREDYSERTRLIFQHNWNANDAIKSVVPTEVLEHMMPKPLVIHYHKDRPTKQFVPMHVDGGNVGLKPHAAINMPVIGCDHKCLTNFWYTPNGYERVQKAYSMVYESGDLEVGLEYCMTDQPILFNTGELHSTANYNDWDRERCIISWRFKSYVSWEDAKEMLHIYLQPSPQMTDLKQLD